MRNLAIRRGHQGIIDYYASMSSWKAKDLMVEMAGLIALEQKCGYSRLIVVDAMAAAVQRNCARDADHLRPWRDLQSMAERLMRFAREVENRKGLLPVGPAQDRGPDVP
jgi:Ser/Thr protein kinase RdoA (MazF antagonist)